MTSRLPGAGPQGCALGWGESPVSGAVGGLGPQEAGAVVLAVGIARTGRCGPV